MNASLRRVRDMCLMLAFTSALFGARSGIRHSPVTVEAAQEHTYAATENVIPNDPFLSNNGLIPPPSQYQGPIFSLSHEWPSQALPLMKNPPWLQAIGGERSPSRMRRPTSRR